jgi:hypothetical protein
MLTGKEQADVDEKPSAIDNKTLLPVRTQSEGDWGQRFKM